MVTPTETDDPLTLALVPSLHETKDQRRVRERDEARARMVNDEIELRLAREREEVGKRGRPLKVVFVGQKGSGRTTMIREFHLAYAKEQWDEERASWRAVIYLNLVQGVNDVLEHLVAEMTEFTGLGSQIQNDEGCRPKLEFGDEYWRLCKRLAPLKSVEMELEKILGVADRISSTGHAASHAEALRSMIDSSDTWKSVLSRASDKVGGDITEKIISCCTDIGSLWNDARIKEILSRRKAQVLEDHVRFFLDDVERIAAEDYSPTDDDIIHVRFKSPDTGIQEYKITPRHGQEWHLYNVRGTKYNDTTWHPYLDDADAIIFLAPLSTFDEKLPEDERINRLENSYLLWRSVCSSRILAGVHIILFLNNCDVLQAKLQRGIRIRDSIPSYGDRNNNLQTGIRYFQQHFKEIARQYSPVPRPFYVHITTSTVDITTLACLLRTASKTELPI